MSKDYLICFLLIAALINSPSFSQNAAFISQPGVEGDSAFAVLKSILPNSERISLSDISKKHFNLIWIHSTDSSGYSYPSGEISQLKKYINDGGKLFITIEAFPLVHQLGLETQKPEQRYAVSKDEGYGRKLGIHSFIEHPVFNDLHGGAYIWNAYQDNTTRMWGYFDNNIPKGKTIAVDWAYITLKENSKLLLEYDYGKGKVIAAGAYTIYSPGNYNKDHLKLFTKNCISYLLDNFKNQNKYYWNYDNVKVSREKISSIARDSVPSRKWDEIDVLNMKSDYASDNYWDLAGERILIMGKEKGGIDEVWVHPFMALRDYQVGIQFSYRDTIYWLNDERPQVEVSPAYIKRTYKFRRAFLTEIISADPDRPAGVIHYEYRGVFPAKLFIKVKSNLRLMWPYSEHAFREMHYDGGNGYLHFRTNPAYLSAMIAANKNPYNQIYGQYSDFINEGGVFKGIPSEELEAAGLLVYELKMNDNLDICFSGSSGDNQETVTEFNNAAKDPYEIYSRSAGYVNKFFENKLSVVTPDDNFNEGYKWALIGSDKFYVNTPGIGSSLVAGYSTTARGWGGGHKVNGRPGYAWYFGRDAQWSGFALLDYGDFEKVKGILQTFNKYQDLSGKIYHELTTSGAVHYDAADATPLYVILAGRYLRFSGDKKFIQETLENIKKAIDFCYSTDTDGDKLIENTNVGHGWVEGGSLYGAHTTLYLAACWAEALKEASYIDGELGLIKDEDLYQKDYLTVKEIINRDFWNQEDNFFYYGKLPDGSYNPEKTVLPSIPLYFRLADANMAGHVLDDYAGNGFTSDWGVRILSSESKLFNPAGYHYGSVWPLFTGWTALAEYKYGNYLQGYSHMMNNLNVYKSFSKGYVEEVLNGAVYKPSGVCPHQCWSETMVLQPLIEGMLGLDVESSKNHVTISPVLPADWRYAEVKNIRSGNNLISYRMRKEDGVTKWSFEVIGDEVEISFNPAVGLMADVQRVTFNGSEIKYNITKEHQNFRVSTSFKLKGKGEIKIFGNEGISLLPVILDPIPGDSSSGLRIISAAVSEGKILKIFLEGEGKKRNFVNIYSRDINLLSSDDNILSRKGDVYTLEIDFGNTKGYTRKTINLEIIQ